MLNFYETDLFPLQVFEQNGQWKYRYQLDADHRGEVRDETFYVYTLKEGLDSQGIRAVDSFAIVVTDEFGGTSSQALDVNLSPLSHSPECDDVNINWPTTASGDPLSFATGALSFRDADLDYDPAESLTLAVNTTVISGGKVSVQGEHGTLTIEANGGKCRRNKGCGKWRKS